MRKNIIRFLNAICLICASTSFAATLSNNLNDIQNKVLEITKEDYLAGKMTAINDPSYLGDFTNHTEEHVLMVAEKSLEIMQTFQKAIKAGTFQKEGTFAKNASDENRINFGTGIGDLDIIVASICHDSGMKKGGYILSQEGNLVFEDSGKPKKATEGYDIRKNHALNSAINVLSKRKQLEELGANVDVVCMLCFAHSKSTSGIKDINRKSDWLNGFNKLEKVIEAYNSEHKDKIYFYREKFEKDSNLFSALTTAALALRLGDVSRDSGKHAKSQSDGEIVVYTSTVNSYAKDANGEAEKALVYNYRTGYIKSLFSRTIHIGEQNNYLNNTILDSDGKVYHSMAISNANYAPHCTFQNILEHCGELESAPDADIKIKITASQSVNPKFQAVYDEMRQTYYDKKGQNAIKIIYKWEQH